MIMTPIVPRVLISAAVVFFASLRASQAATCWNHCTHKLSLRLPGMARVAYLRTARGDFPKENFQAEVTVTIKGGGGNGWPFRPGKRGSRSRQL